MLTEDDDAPLLSADDEIKSEILSKLEMMREIVCNWTDESEKIVKVVKNASPTASLIETKLKVIEVAAKILEAIGYGTVILPTAKRLHMVKVWLPFVRVTQPQIDSVTIGVDGPPALVMDTELWQSLESTFVSMISALLSSEQADILAEFLTDKDIEYPDLTEAFELWCYKSKVSKRRLSLLAVKNEEMDTCH